jgi:hypothetical protein
MYNKFKAANYFTIFLLLFSFAFPFNASADWVDKSDQLPGMDADYTLVYVAGAALLATLIFFVANSGDDDNDEPAPNSAITDSSSVSSALYQPNGFTVAAVKTLPQVSEQALSVNPYVGLKRAPKLSGNRSNKTLGAVVVGVSLKF